MTAKSKTHDVVRVAVEQRAPRQTLQAGDEHDQMSHPEGVLPRTVAKPPAELRPADVLALQRTVGNRVVQRMLTHRPGPSSTSAPTIQRQPEEDECPRAPTPRSENQTGLPDRLKAGIENLSGLSLEDVRVHRNSPKPAELRARAYTQGTNIHLGPNEEEHLPHEAWHVVQQKQGRVKPTLQAKGLPINEDPGLESEADVMGAQAMSHSRYPKSSGLIPHLPLPLRSSTQLTPEQIQLRRTYSWVAGEFKGNNDVQVRAITQGTHLSIVDPPPQSREFAEFHITYENNVKDANPHFYYSDVGQYNANHETDYTNEKYQTDVTADQKAAAGVRKNLPDFGTLKVQADGHADDFVRELDQYDEEARQRRIAAQEQRQAEADARQGITGLKLISKQKPAPAGQSIWGAKPTPYTDQEMATYRTHIVNLMPTPNVWWESLIQNAKHIEVKVKLQNYGTQGARAYKAAAEDKKIDTAIVTKEKL